MQPLICAKNITVCLAESKQVLIEDASFEVYKGSIVLLSGDSGSGKSTLLKLLAGQLAQTSAFEISGSVSIYGHELIGNDSFDTAKYISYVGQIPDNQIIYGTVEDEIAFPLENAAATPSFMHEEVSRLCKLFDLNPIANTLTLSGGQKERLCIASALATQKKLLLLDEPLASLDMTGAKSLLLTLQKLAQAGYSIVIADHRLATLKGLIERCYEIVNHRLYRRDPKDISHKTTEFVESYHDLVRATFSHAKGEQALLKLQNIEVKQQKRSIISIDFLSIHAGDIILLVGDNGAGKTTLLNVIASIIKTKRPGKRDCSGKVCMLWQNPEYQLFTPTVAQELSLRSDLVDDSLELLDDLGLGSALNQHPLSLSEGQKRRLIFAATLAANPDIVVLDEPFQGQDADSIAMQIDKLIAWHKSKDAAIIISTHDIRGLMPHINRVLWMREGRIIHDSAQKTPTAEALPIE